MEVRWSYSNYTFTTGHQDRRTTSVSISPMEQATRSTSQPDFAQVNIIMTLALPDHD